MSQGYTMQTAEGATARGGESVIDQSTAFDGVLRAAGNVRVEGQAKGEIHCEGTLFIDEGATVSARVIASNIAVAGTLSGEVTCQGKLQILPTGRVSGKIATMSLVIQEGAIYEGELRMSNVGDAPDAGAAVEPMQVTTESEPDSATVPAGSPAPATGTPYRMAPRRGRDGRRDDEQRNETAAVPGTPERTPDGDR